MPDLAPTHTYESLIERIQELEGELAETRHRYVAAQHTEHQQRRLAARRLTQLKTVQTLNLGAFSSLKEADMFALACQSTVRQLGWDSAFVFSITTGRSRIRASYQATEKQLRHIEDYIGQTGAVADAYSNRISLNTYRSNDASALALRSLFQSEEVVAHPIVFGGQCSGYLAVCSHTGFSNMQEEAHGQEDIEFLASMASLLGHALQQSTSLISLEEQNAKLRQLDELKDSFISITSHQLRTPLSIIKWILSILQTDKSIEPLAEQRKLIDQAYETNERLIHVVNDLLNVSRIEEGKLPYNPQPANLGEVMQELCANMARLYEPKGIRLTVEIDKGLPQLPLDPILFKEAVQNLLDNATDYNLPQEGWIYVGARLDGDWVRLTVKNPGPGISPAELEKIFVQFYRSPGAITMHPNGNGLGLYLARAIIEQHGGTLECESAPGADTVFTASIPLTKKKA